MQTISRAEFRFVRLSPTKVRGVVNLVRGKRVEEALDILRYCPKRGATPVLKLIKSAIANADQKGGVDVDRLVVSKICVDGGPRLRRFRPRSRGMSNRYNHLLSHISVELGEK